MYDALSDAVGQYCKELSVYPIVIGSTGLVHQRTLQCLKGCVMPEKQAKGLCKWYQKRHNGCKERLGTCDVD